MNGSLGMELIVGHILYPVRFSSLVYSRLSLQLSLKMYDTKINVDLRTSSLLHFLHSSQIIKTRRVSSANTAKKKCEHEFHNQRTGAQLPLNNNLSGHSTNWRMHPVVCSADYDLAPIAARGAVSA